MNPAFVLDACALIAYLNDEEGAALVENCLLQASEGKASLYMHKLNLLEVYYGFYRSSGEQKADEMLADVLGTEIEIIEALSDAVFREAGRLKAAYRISLADSVALAEARLRKAAILTSDHHEMDVIADCEPILFKWMR